MSEWSFSRAMRLDGKVILIAGVGGLGSAIARGLADAGADLAIADINLDLATQVADEVRAMGRKAKTIKLNISSVEDCHNAVEEALTLGPLWGAANCVGTNIRELAVDVVEDHFAKIMDVNLKGAYFFAQQAAKAMIKQGNGGRIVTLSSHMGLIGMEDRTVYCASKGGIVAMARPMAVEWAPYGITVNTIAPNFTITPLNAKALEAPGLIPRIEARIPMGRLGEPEDLVGAAVFLLSESSGFITGHTLPVDGGWVAS